MFKIFKTIRRYLQGRRDRLYFKSRWNLIFDLSLALIIIILLGTLITLYLYRPEVSNFLKTTPPLKHDLDLNNPPVDLTFFHNQTLKSLNDKLLFKLDLKNNSQIEIKDLKISLVLLDKNFSLSKIEFDSANELSQARAVIKGQHVIIESLAAQETIDLNLDLLFKAKSETSKLINWQAQIEYSVQGQLIKETSPLADVYLASNLKASAVAYYNSPQGDQLGSGPLPPLVSLPTNYWIFFDVVGNGNFNNMVFSAKLAPGVALSGNKSLLAGSFNYNPSLRQVVWTVPKIDAFGDNYRLGFEVQFIPTENQLDSIPNLITDIKYYAYDALIKDESYYNLDNVTTNLDADRLNKGQGKVAQP